MSDIPSAATYRFFVVEAKGLNSGYIQAGPFSKPPKAIKAKNRYDRKLGVEHKVVEDPDHPTAHD